jgi:hypothetical protein
MPNPPRLLRARLINNYNIKRPEIFFIIFITNE